VSGRNREKERGGEGERTLVRDDAAQQLHRPGGREGERGRGREGEKERGGEGERTLVRVDAAQQLHWPGGSAADARVVPRRQQLAAQRAHVPQQRLELCTCRGSHPTRRAAFQSGEVNRAEPNWIQRQDTGAFQQMPPRCLRPHRKHKGGPRCPRFGLGGSVGWPSRSSYGVKSIYQGTKITPKV
jgi:hypothetical protein